MDVHIHVHWGTHQALKAGGVIYFLCSTNSQNNGLKILIYK